MKRLIVTIDGPAGAGKTTVSRMLAQRLGYRYIDTGALYRAVAFEARSAGIRIDDDGGLEELCSRLKLTFSSNKKGLRLLSNGADITDLIRTPEISMAASAVSARPVVREFLLKVQRSFARRKGIVIEGRDMGTVVFPNADIKFYLDADPEERARRRFAELKDASGHTIKSVREEMQKRDQNDSSRPLAPLRCAEDAIFIDSTHLTAEQVVDCMLSEMKQAMNK
ncbi:MAG: (d)CMP kinase [Deltaproteobacteria bacterium]|nr:(d)CMP kinase [Deltaproteobacteria bacterium]MBW1961057.1 (d)CMP kinase [Deltaproteobacteria bacterium]MBW1993119.1 (d)CMP kinase [Deltaproteobacteria bacterium]MBW2150073.1 (d)CMP kinase [Deltaproteobacteria bacterium]